MSRFALVGKEIYELVIERRLLLTLFLVSAVFSVVFGVMANQSPLGPQSPLEFLLVAQHIGPVMVALLAIALAGDAIARERQDRTLDLLFTAPATLSRYWWALLSAHLLAFVVLGVLMIGFAVLAGAVMGWVAVKGMTVILVIALLPLFLTLDLLLLAFSARLASGRTSLLVALVVVMTLWSTSLIGPFGWVFRGLPWWNGVSMVHPFDLASTSVGALLERGGVSLVSVLSGWLEVLAVGLVAWFSLVTKEVGR